MGASPRMVTSRNDNIIVALFMIPPPTNFQANQHDRGGRMPLCDGSSEGSPSRAERRRQAGDADNGVPALQSFGAEALAILHCVREVA